MPQNKIVALTEVRRYEWQLQAADNLAWSDISCVPRSPEAAQLFVDALEDTVKSKTVIVISCDLKKMATKRTTRAMAEAEASRLGRLQYKGQDQGQHNFSENALLLNSP
ncbi:hypothetical protein Tco_0038153 [Tanacetum coccineum]